MNELDQTVLAVIARDGPLSAYDVRQTFSRSPTPSWSSSSGSIYPVIKRLSEGGLVQRLEPQGGRRKQELIATSAGRDAAKKWIGSIGDGVAAPTPDPVRTRAYFMDLLSSDERQRFIRTAIDQTTAALATAEAASAALEEGSSEQCKHLASLGVLYELQGRLRWLEMVASRL